MTAVRRSRETWLLRTPAADAESLLFCFPYPGTGASMYYRWPRRIGSTEVCPVQLPGRENRMREPPWESYEALAEQLIEGLGRFFERPFGFFGHCGSVFIGVETALMLDRRGLPVPAHLFVSSAMPPHEAHEAQLLSIPEEELGEVVVSLMRARGLEPSAEILELSLEPMKADVRAHRRYRRHDRPRLPCPVTAIGWTDDDTLPASRLPGWLEYGTVEVVVLEGTHWSFLDAPPALQERIAQGFEADRVGAAA